MKVHKYEFRDEDILIDGAVPEAKVYVLEADALVYGRSERKAGAKQEREDIQEIVYGLTDKERVVGDMIMSAINRRSRGAKVCTCKRSGGEWSDKEERWVHAPPCPSYVAPASPAPLEEMPIPATGVEHLALQWQIAAKLNEAIRALNALIAKEARE